jgi:hypothetical protein
MHFLCFFSVILFLITPIYCTQNNLTYFGSPILYGDIPSSSEAQDIEKLGFILESLYNENELNDYLYENGGFIISAGVTSDGLILIECYYKIADEIDDNDFKAVSDIINKYASHVSIDKANIVFVSSDMVQFPSISYSILIQFISLIVLVFLFIFIVWKSLASKK